MGPDTSTFLWPVPTPPLVVSTNVSDCGPEAVSLLLIISGWAKLSLPLPLLIAPGAS